MATLRRSGKIAALIASLALPVLGVFGAVGAAADHEPVAKPPLYWGDMSFPNIQGPEGSEVYSWTVQLDDEQELVQIDDRNAVVYWKDSGEPPRTAFHILTIAAHDAIGTNVPTSLTVSAGDVISLTVHHRAGNPLAGGAPFDYPIIAGVGWEGGFQTHQIQMPPNEIEIGKPAGPACLVPKLTGRTLAASRARLASAGCRLGTVRGKRRKAAKVVKQFRPPGSLLAAGAKVAVKLRA